MDPALKKRMIGAVVLIVLAIIFVPMLFNGRPPTRNESVDLSLPAPPYRDSVDLNGQQALRVRAGPYVDKSDAEKARLLAKRTRADAPGKLVEVDDSPAHDVPASAVSAKTATGWAVQVGAFQSETDANT